MTRQQGAAPLAPLATRQRFYSRFWRSASLSAVVVAVSLGIGAIGYHALQPIGWIDAFHKAAMILSGMGPVDPFMTSPIGKLFEAAYALYSAVILLTAAALLIAPVFHRVLHRFHLEDSRE